mmetsp:Transcript_110077/g.321996  ORF Transcript_110077/g.321996 Transcript_110077/m.321996 type:complete len:228 (-) Transcript_110077:1568-2251(-)
MVHTSWPWLFRRPVCPMTQTASAHSQSWASSQEKTTVLGRLCATAPGGRCRPRFRTCSRSRPSTCCVTLLLLMPKGLASSRTSGFMRSALARSSLYWSVWARRRSHWPSSGFLSSFCSSSPTSCVRYSRPRSWRMLLRRGTSLALKWGHPRVRLCSRDRSKNCFLSDTSSTRRCEGTKTSPSLGWIWLESMRRKLFLPLFAGPQTAIIFPWRVRMLRFSSRSASSTV